MCAIALPEKWNKDGESMSFFLQPFALLGKRLFYKLLLIDFAFLLIMFSLGILMSWKEPSYSRSIMAGILWLFIFIAVTLFSYLITKHFSFRLMGRASGIPVLLRQVFAMLIAWSLALVFYIIFKRIASIVVLPEKFDTVRAALITVMLAVCYMLYLLIQKHYTRSIIRTLWKSFKSLFDCRNYIFIYHDLIYLLVCYLAYNALMLSFQFITIKFNLSLTLLNTPFVILSNLMLLLSLASIVLVNKLIVFSHPLVKKQAFVGMQRVGTRVRGSR